MPASGPHSTTTGMSSSCASAGSGSSWRASARGARCRAPSRAPREDRPARPCRRPSRRGIRCLPGRARSCAGSVVDAAGSRTAPSAAGGAHARSPSCAATGFAHRGRLRPRSSVGSRRPTTPTSPSRSSECTRRRIPTEASAVGTERRRGAQRCPARTLHRAEDRALVAESHLSFGGVHVDVERLRRDLDGDDAVAVASAGDEPAIRLVDGGEQRPVVHASGG